MSKESIAIVVQRCHESVIGGSESYAWHHATLLKESYQVDILTTTAVDAATWANDLPPGVEKKEGVTIRRFEVSQGRTPYWYLVNQRLGFDFKKTEQRGSMKNSQNRFLNWSLALQEEYIRKQGPYSANFLTFLSEHVHRYKSVIFLTYLFPTTYFGILQCPQDKCLLVPTLHDEPPAYLSAYRHMAARACALLWNTKAEKELSNVLWGDLPGTVLGMSINTKEYAPLKIDYPYLLYSGRIDPYKGCKMLVEYFLRYKNRNPSDLRLILTGHQEMEIPINHEIEFRGLVTDEEKFQLMAGAMLFVMPSLHESLSVVTLEAMAQSTPVLVNSGCQVLVDHVVESGGGMTFENYQDFSRVLRKVMAGETNLLEMGKMGRVYVADRYSFAQIKQSLVKCVEDSESTVKEIV